MGVCNCSMFCCTLLYVHSIIEIILMEKRELVALLILSCWCLAMVERLVLAMPRGCLRFVIVVFPDHTHLLFLKNIKYNESFRIYGMRKNNNCVKIAKKKNELKLLYTRRRARCDSYSILFKLCNSPVFYHRNQSQNKCVPQFKQYLFRKYKACFNNTIIYKQITGFENKQ